MEAENCLERNVPVLKTHYEIGDWVCERGMTGKLSPDMYIVGMWSDTVYLEMTPEQGDPFEVDLADIKPIPLTKEILQSIGVYGKRIVTPADHIIDTVPGVITKWELNDWVDIHKYKDKFIAKYHGRDDEYLHVVYLRYVHELQHFFRMFNIDKVVVL